MDHDKLFRQDAMSLARYLKPMLVVMLVIGNTSANAATCQSGPPLKLSSYSSKRDPANITPREAIASYKKGDVAVIAYFKGVADGLTWSGAAARVNGSKELFCEPQVDFNADLAVKVLENYLIRVQSKPDINDPCGPLASVILHAFQSAYPCR